MSDPTPPHKGDARARLDAALAAADLHRAIQAARELLARPPGPRMISSLRAAFEGPHKAALGLKPIRVALLSSFSIEFVHDALVLQGFLEGLDVQLYQAGFGQFRQEILAPDSGLAAFAPDVTVLAVQGEDWVPAVYGAYLESSEDRLQAAVDAALAEVGQLAATFAERVRGLLLVHNAETPLAPALGILDGKTAVGQGELVQRLNAGLAALARRHADLHLVDCARLAAELGRERWLDARMAHYAKAPVSAAGLWALSGAYAHFLRARAGRTRKCLVLDLDNTLWGGIVGEDGVDGLRLGPDYPGSAFVEFQQCVADLGRRGVLLAISSKNNAPDAWEVFERHPHMRLRREDFVAARIDWTPKSESLRAIAQELNLGLEHFVFADDNPAECAQVRETLPMVTVVELPRAPEHYARALLRDGWFDSLSFSKEDRRRTELYRQRREAEDLVQRTDSLEDYYRQLQMRVTVERVSGATRARAAQMTQKTNQFNTTTRRCTEGEIDALSSDPAWLALTVRVADRFGDHGVVGLMLARERHDALDVDALLLSCRVIGRTVETAMLSVLSDEASGRGLSAVTGRIVPTAKNVPVRDLFRRHGFERVSGDDDGESVWRLSVGAGRGVACPEWITLESPVAV